MAVLSFSNITQSFGDFDVFVGATASIPQNGKVGIVGPNGIGKTTLLRVLAGLEEPSGGAIHFAKGTQIGYLRQEAVRAFAGKENTVYQEMLTVFATLRDQEQELKEIEQRMEDGDFDEALFERYSGLQTDFEMSGGYDYDIRIRSVLTGLGFRAEHYDLPLNILSGGQKTRALLARLLLENPDLLILDEPTNHLDIDAVEWLEGALKVWEGSVLIVSHDRYFLDRVVNNIWELGRSGIEAYRGNYTHYVQQREERWALRQADFDTMQDKFLKELDFIKRNIARDSTKDQAVGRLKRLIRQVKMAQVGGSTSVLKMKWSVARDQYDISSSRWEVPDVESAIKSLPRPSGNSSQMHLNLKASHRSGGMVLRTQDLAVGYNGTALFTSEDIELRRLEVAALIGSNGTGKTSFLKTIQETIPVVTGKYQLGASLQLGYFAQAHDKLDPNKKVLNELIDHSNMLIPDARNFLGRFLFRGDDVYKPISLLSGGERGRLALAMLEFEKANFLLMDEPTNHLDIPSQEVLQDAIGRYDGTILMVSHDRYLIDKLATQIWEVRDGHLRVFKGSYQEYLAVRAREKDTAKQAASAAHAAQKKVAADNRAKEKAKTAVKSKRSKNEQRKFERQLVALEKMVERMESEFERVSADLQTASETGDFDKIRVATENYKSAEQDLAVSLEAWETLANDA
ncbi:MAG: ribosomal protection-like ABC-F family protein [Candidatus Promineifilaceae bacterium]